MNLSDQNNSFNPISYVSSFPNVNSLLHNQSSSPLAPASSTIYADESRNFISYEAGSPQIASVSDEYKNSDSDESELANQVQWEALTRDILITQEKRNQDSVFNTTRKILQLALNGEFQDQPEAPFENEARLGSSTEFTKSPANESQESTAYPSASTEATSGGSSQQVSSEEEPVQNDEISELILKKRRAENNKEIWSSTEVSQEDEPASKQVNVEDILSKRNKRKAEDQSRYKFVYHPLWRYSFDILKGFMSPLSFRLYCFALDFQCDPDESSKLMQELPFAADEIKQIQDNDKRLNSDSDFDMFDPEGLGSLFKAFAKLEEAFKIDVSTFDAFKKNPYQ